MAAAELAKLVQFAASEARDPVDATIYRECARNVYTHVVVYVCRIHTYIHTYIPAAMLTYRKGGEGRKPGFWESEDFTGVVVSSG